MMRRRGPGPNELDAVLSARDRSVVEGIAAHRFLTTRQVQRWYFTDHATQATATRITTRTLHRLHSLHVLERLERRVGGIRAGSASFTWAIGPSGDRWLQTTNGEGVRRRFEEPSATFLQHTLAVADTHLQLVEAQRLGMLDLISVELEPNCWRTYPGGTKGPQTLRPDLYVVTGHGEYELHTFLEVDRATESIPAVLRACRRYQDYRRTGREQQATGTFPHVLWLVPNEARRDKLTDAISQARDLDTALFSVYLSADVVTALSNTFTLTKGGDYA